VRTVTHPFAVTRRRDPFRATPSLLARNLAAERDAREPVAQRGARGRRREQRAEQRRREQQLGQAIDRSIIDSIDREMMMMMARSH
jgi:hypothetical protein